MVGKKQESTTVAVTTSGRRGRNVAVMAVTATLMLLIGLVTPVAAAVPDPPTNLTASPTTSSTASLSWTPPLTTFTGYRIEVTPAPASVPANPALGDTSATVTGLTPGTTYTINLFSVDGPDESASAASADVTTTAAPGAPNLTGVTGGQNQATLAFTPGPTNGSTVTGFEATFTPTQGSTGVAKTEVLPVSGNRTVTQLVAGQYTVTVRALATPANSALSNVQPVTINAPPPAVPGPPGTVTVSNSGSTINVAWTAAPGVVEDYLVQLRQGNTVVQSKPAGGLGTSFGGVSPGSYTLRVVARNVSGEGPERTANYTLTLAASAPRNVDATVNTSNTVVITWLAPLDDGGGVGEYRISLSPASADTKIVSGGTTTTSFSGLPSGNYTVSVVAVNGAGTSDAGTDSFSIVVPPGSPLNVKTTAPSTTNGTATVTWDPPANNGNGTISEYVVTLGGKTVTVAASAPRTASFTGLPIGKLTATVQARNAQGLSAAGSSPEFFSKRPVHPFTTREAFARQAFIDLFGVAATPGEVTEIAAATAVDGSNAPAVIANLMQGDRFENRRQVSRLYFAYFLRVPDAAGQEYWGAKMDRGELDLQGVSDLFALSPEFRNTYGGLDEQEFLVVVYNNVLGRAADVAGFNYWLAERNKGLSRGGVMTWFTEGEEYKGLSLPAIDTSLAHIMLLGRSPTSGEYALWVNRITKEPSTSLETLVAVIYESDEYAARVKP